MTKIKTLISDVLEVYRGTSTLWDIEFVNEFPNKKHDLPLRYPIVSVGVDEVNIFPIEEYNSIYFGRSPSTARLKLCICVPNSSGGNACYDVLDRVINATTSILKMYTLIGIKTDEMKYSSSISGLVIPLYITVDTGHAFVV